GKVEDCPAWVCVPFQALAPFRGRMRMVSTAEAPRFGFWLRNIRSLVEPTPLLRLIVGLARMHASGGAGMNIPQFHDRSGAPARVPPLLLCGLCVEEWRRCASARIQ